MKPALPRLFHADSEALAWEPSGEPDLVDAFDWEGHGCTAAWLDEKGLVRLAERDGSALPAALKRAMGERLVAGIDRSLAAKRLWTFALDGWEPGSDLPGPDDPVHLRGRLLGPFPGTAAAHAGLLTSTRLEVLDGLVRGYSMPASSARPGVWWSSFLLAGGDQKDTAARDDAVLVIPGARVLPRVLGNDKATLKLTLELIESLQRDLASGKARGPWTKARLPVASRKALEEDLRARGFKVEGERAVKKRGGLLGVFFHHVLRLPPQADRAQVLALANTFLDAIALWPSDRARALQVMQWPYEVGWAPKNPRGVKVVRFDGWASCETGTELLLFPSKKEPVARAWLRLGEGFLAAAPKRLEVAVDVLDVGGEMALVAQTSRGKPTGSALLRLGDTYQPRTVSLVLENARLENQLEGGASLAIGYRGKGGLNVRRIRIKRPR